MVSSVTGSEILNVLDKVSAMRKRTNPIEMTFWDWRAILIIPVIGELNFGKYFIPTKIAQ